MAEFLYATSHITGDFANPTNANGNTPSTWAGTLNANVSPNSRWAIGDPADPLTALATQTIRVVARKGSNSGTPTVEINLWENGVLVSQIVAPTNITSTTGQTLTGTFATEDVTNAADVEIQVIVVGVGGSPSARNSAQISHIEWEADTSASTTFFQTVAVTSTMTPIISDILTFKRTLAVSSTMTPAITRLLSFKLTLAIASTMVSVIVNVTTYKRTLAAASVMTAAMAKKLFKTLAVVSTFTAEISSRLVQLKTLAASSVMAAVLTTKYIKSQTIAATSTFVAALVTEFIEGGSAILEHLKMTVVTLLRRKRRL